MTRHLQIRMENEDYEKLEKIAEARGVSLNALGLGIVLGFLREGKATGPLADLTRVEESCLHAILDILRDNSIPADDPSRMKHSLLALGNRWLKKSRGRTT